MEPQLVEKVRFGELLVRQEVITREQLEEALIFQKRQPVYRPLGEICAELGLISRLELRNFLAEYQKQILLGDLLVNMGIVNDNQVSEALETQRESGKRLGQILIDKGYATQSALADALSMQLGIPKIAPNIRLVDEALLDGMNASFFYTKGVVPLSRDDERDTLTVIMDDPLDFATIADLEKIYKTKIEPAVSATGETALLLDYIFNPGAKMGLEGAVAPSPSQEETIIGATNLKLSPSEPDALVLKIALPTTRAVTPGLPDADLPTQPPSGKARLTGKAGRRFSSPGTTESPAAEEEPLPLPLEVKLPDEASEPIVVVDAGLLPEPEPEPEPRPSPPGRIAAARRPQTERLPVEPLRVPTEKDMVIDHNTPLRSVTKENTVGILDFVVSSAVKEGASDIHIEPLENRVRVRYRVDGLLRHKTDLPTSTGASLTGRIKALCGLDIAERRRHQDGRIQARVMGKDVDLRVSTYAAIWGENIVIRILHRQSSLVDLNRTGLTPLNLDKYQRILKYPAGIILVTGPTGSGKTTTLYGSLLFLNDMERKIITVEDPVEYTIDGVVQAKLDPKLHMTYDDFIKSMMRQDPDVIMIGEIRDEAGAAAAVQAALTGHKVFSTFHTDDSTSALVRLMNMGIETFLISSTVVAIIAQRLVRTLCPACKEPGAPSPLTLKAFSSIRVQDIDQFTFYRPKGCHQCSGTGYKGRTTVQELLEMNDPIREAILLRKDVSQIRVVARRTAHLISMAEDGFYKAAKGQTTLEEVQRVVYISASDALVPYDGKWLVDLCDAPEADTPTPFCEVKEEHEPIPEPKESRVDTPSPVGQVRPKSFTKLQLLDAVRGAFTKADD